MSILPTPSSSSRSWWSRSSVLSKSPSDKLLPYPQGSRHSASKKLSTIATAIGLKPKKTATAVKEPPSPILPLHTGDIDTPPRPAKKVVKPVSVAVGWSDPRALQEEFLDAYPQSVFSTDLDPFATAAKYPDGPPNVSDSLRYSTFSEVSVLDPHVRQDAAHTHNRMSFASSSSLSHHRSDVTSDSSLISSPLFSPIMSGSHLSRLTVESDRMREHFPPSPVSPQSFRGWDDRSRLAPSPSSTTLTDSHGKGTTVARSRTRSRGIVDTGISGTDPLLSDQKASSTSGPVVVIRQPSSSKLQSLQPPTPPPSSKLPPAPGDAQRHDFSLLPAFVEPTPQSATSSSSSLSFASSASSILDALEVEGHRRDMRRFKDAKKPGKSRPASPLKDAIRDVHDSTSKPSRSSREFSPTRTLKKAISIQSIPKWAPGNGKPPSLPAVEDSKSMKKQRSFHHSRIPRPPLPTSLRQTGSSNASGRDVPEEPRVNVQLPQKSPLSSPVSSPTNVRKRLFSGTSLRVSMSSQAPDPDDDNPSIFSLPSAISALPPPHTTPISGSSVSNKQQMSSFWDDEIPINPNAVDESRDIGPRHILSVADILKLENMVLGENHNGFVRSRENSITSTATSNHPVRTAHDPAIPVGSGSPPSAARQFYSLGTASSRSLALSRQRTRGISLQGKKVAEAMNGRSQIGVISLGQAGRSLSSQSLSALHGLPQPPRQRTRPSTSSGASSPAAEDAPSGDRTSFIALMPLSPPPARRSVTRRTLDPPAVAPIMRPVVSRRPSFLDMRDDLDREPPPPDDSFLDMGKVSLDTVRSGMENDLTLT